MKQSTKTSISKLVKLFEAFMYTISFIPPSNDYELYDILSNLDEARSSTVMANLEDYIYFII